MNNKKEVNGRFFDAEVRCERFIPIYMCLAERPSQDLMDAVLEEDGVYDLLDLPRDIEPSDIYEVLYHTGKFGFLAEFATPIPIHFGEGGRSWISGWGYYRKKWFYADDIESLEDAAVEWAQDHFEECKTKAMSEVKNG